MALWHYEFDGDYIGEFKHADDDPPYVGMPITWVGRSEKLAPAEYFVVRHVVTVHPSNILNEDGSPRGHSHKNVAILELAA